MMDMRWRRRKGLAFSILAAGSLPGSALAQAPADDALVLDCPGEATSSDTITDADDRRVSIDQKYGTTVQVEITAGAGRVRLPGKMTPLINSGTDDWFKMSNLKTEPDRITADVRTSFIRIKTLEIDRRTGNIRIEGGDTFYGRCDRRPTTNRF
jgi:hypothetical protein